MSNVLHLTTGPIVIYDDFITLIEHDVPQPRVVYLIPGMWDTMFTAEIPSNRMAFVPSATMIEIEERAPYPKKAKS